MSEINTVLLQMNNPRVILKRYIMESVNYGYDGSTEGSQIRVVQKQNESSFIKYINQIQLE